jgi:hypothetical protein
MFELSSAKGTGIGEVRGKLAAIPLSSLSEVLII